MLKQKRVLIPLALAAIVSLGTAVYLLIFQSAKAPEPPMEYVVGEDTVESLSSVLGLENSGELADVKTPDTASSDASSGTESGGDAAYYYTYQKLEAGGEIVRQYVEHLTEAEVGFRIVDENGVVADAPNYADNEGAVSLAKAASEDGWLLRMDISWAAENCQITLTRPEGTVRETAAETAPMTYVEAVDFLKSLSPAKLGLETESLRDYFVYPMDGAVLVDGILCLKLQVYSPHEEGQANAIAGTYLLSGDKAHLYLLEDGAVRALSL